MSKKKAIENFGLYKSSLKSCPRIKAVALKNIRYSFITNGKIYNVENNTPQGYWIMNDRGELMRFDHEYFELLNNGVPIKDEDLQKFIEQVKNVKDDKANTLQAEVPRELPHP